MKFVQVIESNFQKLRYYLRYRGSFDSTFVRSDLMRKMYIRGEVFLWLCVLVSIVPVLHAFSNRGMLKGKIDHSNLPPNNGVGPFLSRGTAKAGLKNNWLKLNEKAKKVDILIDPDPAEPEVLPRRTPPLPGTMDMPVAPGHVGGCCTICTKNFYRSLALLQLPSSVEAEALRRFHKTYEKHIPTSFLEEREDPDKAVDEAVGKDSEEAELEQGDLVHDIEEATNTYKAVGEDAHKTILGQEGTGPCCKICPTSFVPYNSPKLAAKGEVSLPSGNGVEPEDAKAFAPTTF